MPCHVRFLLFALVALAATAAATSSCEGAHCGKPTHHRGHKVTKHHAANRVVKAVVKAKKCDKGHAATAATAPLKQNSEVTNKLAAVTSACGTAKPTRNTTESGGPNGQQLWLNCGIDGAGWNPPAVTFDMLHVVEMDSPVAQSTFRKCTPYAAQFKTAGAKYNIPPIVLASIAMQESGCDPHASGDSGGAFGLMQITKDKCGGAPNGDCTESNYNIDLGAKTLANAVADANGNFLVGLAAYNGWYKGMTKGQATAARNTGCCECQQNLDYLQQSLNGWFQGIDPYSQKIGTVQNLAACRGS